MSSEETFPEVARGLIAGDFSRLERYFDPPPGGGRCRILEWYDAGLFAGEPAALNEAFTCACFNGKTKVAEYLLDHGVDAEAGNGTGVNAFHWAANRGQLDTVNMLIRRGANMESVNSYGGTVLGMAEWSAVHEPRDNHAAIIQALVDAGAKRATG